MQDQDGQNNNRYLKDHWYGFREIFSSFLQFKTSIFYEARWLRWANHIVRIEEHKSALKISTGKQPIGKRPLESPRHR